MIAKLTVQQSRLKLVTDSEGQIWPGLAYQGQIALVGTKGDEGIWGERPFGVNQVGRK